MAKTKRIYESFVQEMPHTGGNKNLVLWETGLRTPGVLRPSRMKRVLGEYGSGKRRRDMKIYQFSKTENPAIFRCKEAKRLMLKGSTLLIGKNKRDWRTKMRTEKKKSFFQNACKPEGFGGKIMIRMMNTGHAALAEWGLQHISIEEQDTVLDIGCGGGANLQTLVSKSSQGVVKGVDYSPVSVKQSRKKNAAAIRAGRCEVVQGNVMELPFEDGVFRVATAFETIYFWPDLLKAFQQVYRVLADGGKFMICNESSGVDPKDKKWTDIIEGMKVYNAGQIQDILQKAGFCKINADQNQKGWLCVTAEKSGNGKEE